MFALTSGVAAAPAMAVDNLDCNWLGYNCRGFWDHGYNDTSVYSNYKHLDDKHGSSTFGTTKSNVRKSHDSGCQTKGNWAYSSLSGVTSSRQAYYRTC